MRALAVGHVLGRLFPKDLSLPCACTRPDCARKLRTPPSAQGCLGWASSVGLECLDRHYDMVGEEIGTRDMFDVPSSNCFTVIAGRQPLSSSRMLRQIVPPEGYIVTVIYVDAFQIKGQQNGSTAVFILEISNI